MERIEIGTVGMKRERVSWSKWEIRPGKYLVTALFGPGKFPTSQISFIDDEKNLFVKKTIDMDLARNLFKKMKDFIGDIYLVIQENEGKLTLSVEFVENPNGPYVYLQDGKNIIRKDATKLNQKEEDVPF